MAVETCVNAWANRLFAHCQLGNVQRTRRLVKTAAQLAGNGGGTVAQACKSDTAGLEGGYRLMRNANIKLEAMMDAGFAATAASVLPRSRLLAIDDSTTLSYAHGIVSALGDTGGKAASRKRGLWVHSAVLVDADTETTEGLIAQQIWSRDPAARGKKVARKKTPYEAKESFKWSKNAAALRQRLGAKMADVIAVSDRESDIFAYLLDKHSHGERYLVRAAQDRVIMDADERLFARLENSEKRGQMAVNVSQRGGRVARTAMLTLRAQTVQLRAPKTATDACATIQLNVVLAHEETPPENVTPLRWLLLTTESIASEDALRDVLRCYGLRWRVEEFHKAWKSGASVEDIRAQSVDNLQRHALLLAFVAIRLLQLRETLDHPAAAERACTEVLTDTQWKILWVSTNKTKLALPKTPPTLRWAYEAIAKLGGFYDSKRTGRASWATIYAGWTRLEERVEVFNLLTALDRAGS